MKVKLMKKIILLVVFVLLVSLVAAAEPQVVSLGAKSGGDVSVDRTGTESQQPENCRSQQKCREIDEIWAELLGKIIRGSTEVWDTVKKDWRSWKEASVAVKTGGCPEGMAKVKNSCMDIYEAPNVKNAEPLVMYTLPEAQKWCESQGKRLCYEDEWTEACSGTQELKWPYGNTYVPGECNDDKIWRTYTPSLLEQWPSSASSTSMASWENQLSEAGNRLVLPRSFCGT